MGEADSPTALSQTDAPPSLTMTTHNLEFLLAQLLQVRKALCFSNMGCGRSGLTAQEMPLETRTLEKVATAGQKQPGTPVKVQSILPTCKKNTAHWTCRYHHLSTVSPGSAGISIIPDK